MPIERTEEPQTHAWLTRSAMLIALGVVIARATMLEIVRDPFEASPNVLGAPRGPGAGTGVVLNVLAMLPAILVLIRSLMDRSFAVRFTLVHGLLLGLGAWAVVSMAWSADKFVALVQAMHLLAAFMLVWAVSQVVRSWQRLRLIAGICFGLLLVYVAHGIIYRYVELPELQRMFQAQRLEIFAQRGWEPDSGLAGQFERKVMAGEMVGFGASPNTYAAMLVMLGIVATGVMIQRLVHRDEPAWAVAIALALMPGAWLLLHTNSRTAYLTVFMAAGLLGLVWLMGDRMARHRRTLYLAGIVGFLLLWASVIVQGITQGHLFHDSLTFRWRYWVASLNLWLDNLLLGVGYANFGAHYLGYRLPGAAEEIQDPHNFIVRMFTELGMVGGLLILAAMLRLWWELTEPTTPKPVESRIVPFKRLLVPLLLPAVLGMLINILASIDFHQHPGYWLVEVLKRLLYLVLLFGGTVAVVLRRTDEHTLDNRPSPWLLNAAILAVGIFLIHNLIDFAMFEVGPMFVLALLLGATLGMRQAEQPRSIPLAGRWTGLGLTGLVWFTALLGVAVPVVRAESLAWQADELLRKNAPARAAAGYLQANELLWFDNADYLARAARAQLYRGPQPDDPAGQAVELLSRAIRANPMNPRYYLSRAVSELHRPQPRLEQVRQDYERAIAINPRDPFVRLEYAELLDRLGDTTAAVEQYRAALAINDAFHPDEPRRLPPARVKMVQTRLGNPSDL